MSAALGGALAPAATAATGTCAHCGDALPRATDTFCCEGCAAASAWIREAGLDDYYRLRDAPAGRVSPELDPAHFDLWDRPEIHAEHVVSRDDHLETTLLTDGMRCAACAWLIDRALHREPGVASVSANAVTGRVRVAWDPEQTRLSHIVQRMAALGYAPSLATGTAAEDARRRTRNRDLLRLGIAGLGAMQAMMLAEALYLDFNASMPLATRDFFRWITLLVSTPVVFYAGWPFIFGAWREWRLRRLGMDTLVAGSTLLAWGASVVETIRGGPHVWYDAAVMFVFLLLGARMLEQRARRLAGAQVDTLARARPAFALRERADGSVENVPTHALAPGDIIGVSVGAVVPADGVLLADALVEESLLTGESAPVARDAGQPVYAGSSARHQPLRMRVTGTGAATRLSELARLVEHAQAMRPALAETGERIAHRFVAALLVTAVVVYLGWQWYAPERALEVTLALLVISCPCALALAVPAALATAQGQLSRLGVLTLTDRALDRLAAATDIVFDKTGTLTMGRPSLVRTDLADGVPPARALELAGALEHASGHPLATAFPSPRASVIASDLVRVPGQGIAGRVDGQPLRIGQAPFAANRADDGAIWLGDGHHALARFEVHDAARPDAMAAVASLGALDLTVRMASGDAEGLVNALARALAIPSPASRQSPEAKLAMVRALQAGGRVVAMVGDGLNDAPVLGGADVSIAMGRGAPLAQRAADLVLQGDSLVRIPQAIEVARRTRTVIRQNLAWALAYNVIAIPLAAAGLVTPWLAALGMAASSLLVVGNALRLSRPVRVPGVAA